MLRITRALLAIAAVTSVAACSESSGPGSMQGSYSLVRIDGINGTGLPVTIFKDPTTEFRVTGGSITLNSDNTFSVSGAGVAIQPGGTTNLSETCTGTYAVSGNGITFTGAPTTDCAGVITGMWDGDNSRSLHNQQRVSYSSFAFLITRLIHEDTVNHHRRRSAAVEIHRLPCAELAHHIRKFDESHPAAAL